MRLVAHDLFRINAHSFSQIFSDDNQCNTGLTKILLRSGIDEPELGNIYVP